MREYANIRAPAILCNRTRSSLPLADNEMRLLIVVKTTLCHSFIILKLAHSLQEQLVIKPARKYIIYELHE